MKVAPILICRTKYNDFKYPVFCAPNDVSEQSLQKLNNSINAQEHIYSPNKSNFIVFSDTNHIIIGKVIGIKELSLGKLDSMLKDGDTLRPAWGFVGGAILRSDYQQLGVVSTLPDNYYLECYLQSLYSTHWEEDICSAPYQSVYSDITLQKIEAKELPEYGEIFEDIYNDNVIWYTLSEIIKGSKNIHSCYTNAEFSAAKKIISNIISITTVSRNNLSIQKKSLESSRKSANSTQFQERNDEPIIKQKKKDIKSILHDLTGIRDLRLVGIYEDNRRVGYGVICRQVKSKTLKWKEEENDYDN